MAKADKKWRLILIPEAIIAPLDADADRNLRSRQAQLAAVLLEHYKIPPPTDPR